jgi:hypothetical protein
MINIDIKYIFIFFLIILFFLYGLILSEIIDYIFPEHDCNLELYRLILEIVGEIGIAYLIYYSLHYLCNQFINILFKKINKKTPSYLNGLLLFAFSAGIFRHLQKSKDKILHFRKTYINPMIPENTIYHTYLAVK